VTANSEYSVLDVSAAQTIRDSPLDQAYSDDFCCTAPSILDDFLFVLCDVASKNLGVGYLLEECGFWFQEF